MPISVDVGVGSVSVVVKSLWGKCDQEHARQAGATLRPENLLPQDDPIRVTSFILHSPASFRCAQGSWTGVVLAAKRVRNVPGALVFASVVVASGHILRALGARASGASVGGVGPKNGGSGLCCDEGQAPEQQEQRHVPGLCRSTLEKQKKDKTKDQAKPGQG